MINVATAKSVQTAFASLYTAPTATHCKQTVPKQT
ncbi:hypothetical protein OROHE_003785 [Orobanche hederae]